MHRRRRDSRDGVDGARGVSRSLGVRRPPDGWSGETGESRVAASDRTAPRARAMPAGRRRRPPRRDRQRCSGEHACPSRARLKRRPHAVGGFAMGPSRGSRVTRKATRRDDHQREWLPSPNGRRPCAAIPPDSRFGCQRGDSHYLEPHRACWEGAGLRVPGLRRSPYLVVTRSLQHSASARARPASRITAGECCCARVAHSARSDTPAHLTYGCRISRELHDPPRRPRRGVGRRIAAGR